MGLLNTLESCAEGAINKAAIFSPFLGVGAYFTLISPTTAASHVLTCAVMGCFYKVGTDHGFYGFAEAMGATAIILSGITIATTHDPAHNHDA